MQMSVSTLQFIADKATSSLLVRFSKDFLRESRTSVQVMVLMRFCTAALLGASILSDRVWAAAVAWLLATLAIYVLNGVMDVAEDRANGSTRPISAGSLPLSAAAGGVVATAALALGIGVISDEDGLLPLLILAYLTCGYAYSAAPFYGKRRGSTAALLVLGGGVLTYAAGWQAAGRDGDLPVLLLGGAMSLWMAGVGALAKDLSDVEGDAAGGRRTPVIRWGGARVRLLIIVNAVLVAGGYLTITPTFAPILLPSAITLAVGASAVGVIAATTRRTRTRAGRRLPYRAFMITQYAVHLTVLATLTVAAVR